MPIITDSLGALTASFREEPIGAGLNRLLVDGFGLPPCGEFKRCSGGLINDTYDGDGVWIVQRVNPIFGIGVNEDIAALVPVLQKRGIPVAQLCRSKSGSLALNGADYGLAEGNYRVMPKLDGVAYDCVDDIGQIRALARMLAAFHEALEGVSYQFVHTRPAVHDFYRHKRALDEALATKREHRYRSTIEKLREEMQKCENSIPIDAIGNVKQRRIIHGDPKVSNFLLNKDANVEFYAITGVIDLDTMELVSVNELLISAISEKEAEITAEEEVVAEVVAEAEEAAEANEMAEIAEVATTNDSTECTFERVQGDDGRSGYLCSNGKYIEKISSTQYVVDGQTFKHLRFAKNHCLGRPLDWGMKKLVIPTAPSER